MQSDDRPPLEALTEMPAFHKLPERLQRLLLSLGTRWPGRMFFRATRAFIRVEMFDRSMTIAAQFFTSVFPLLILGAVWINGNGSDKLGDWLNLPEDSRQVLEESVTSQSSTAISVVGGMIVLISGTSLSRALTRAFAKIWGLPRPKNSVRSVWRWFAALTTLAAALALAPVLRHLTSGLPPTRSFWPLTLEFLGHMAVAVFLPWVLLEGRLRARLFVPGALMFSLALLIAQPFLQLYFPRALTSSSAHYGTIGVAFVFISYLYIVSFVFLAAATLGHVIATDEVWLGRWIRREVSLRETIRRRLHLAPARDSDKVLQTPTQDSPRPNE